MDQKKDFIVPTPDENAHRGKDEHYYQRMGLAIIFIGVIGFFSWAAFAPLDKGVTASGTVIVSGNRKMVQTPVNGIVDKVWIKEGDSVQADAPLITLSRTAALARYEQSRDKYLSAVATVARLEAERDKQATPRYPAALRQEEWQAQGEAVIALQNQLLAARRHALLSEVNTSQHMLAGLTQQIKSLQRALALKRKLNASLQQQLHDMKELVAEHFLPLNRYRELERQQHDTQGQAEELAGQIAVNQKKRDEIEQRIDQIEREYDKEVHTQLEKAAASINEQQNNMQIAAEDLKHTAIVAPVSGTVMSLAVLTPGSVLSAGETLMEIVPDNTPLIIDAQVTADLIDKVTPGLPVNMMFTALNQNRTPVIPGRVSLVSPDRLIDKKSGAPYYAIQVTVSDEGMTLLRHEDIRPGMPVAVLIKTGARSLLSYLFKPVWDRTATALTEE
ncbi:HlyD family type I secretion periplasmic adaptor subunit [Mixta tenebrionis]|uniref:Membrane fusion protein (MFP) family protein n=1 Tax=Mixta tenebrionis TaxID=2562439 RepID=A0A506V4D3_9GAMM|nr:MULTISPECIES: HlyD family type I secretion periplasmic adaptor subunit [Mixta]QHM77736.1 Type I secretion system membrane fusion protein PrsE [Mixta theicola]TPW40497.1 HlyD family type I secretion periplasmic adaptor subunit [Mixta tenebrionis]